MKSFKKQTVRALIVAMTCANLGALSPAIAQDEFTAKPVLSQEKIGRTNYQVARIKIEARVETVWNALTSYDRATELFSNLQRLKLLKDEGDKKQIFFSIASFGGLCKYDYVLNVHEDRAHNRIAWSRHSGAFKVNEGFWQLTPTEDGRGTMVTYAKHIDGGLMLPPVVVNRELKKVMPEVLSRLSSNLREQPQIALH